MEKDYQLSIWEDLGLEVTPKYSPTNTRVLGGMAFHDKKQRINFEKGKPIPNNFIEIQNHPTIVISQL